MTDWVRLSGRGDSVNMAHVVSVEATFDRDDFVVLGFAGGRSVAYEGDQARRILAWLKARAELPAP
jgi:hypothetical protein